VRLLLGGPSYRMEVDARHAASLLSFGLSATLPRIVSKKAFGGKMRDIVTPSPITIVGAAYEHATPVSLARNGLFRAALAAPDVSHLLWLDSDCSIPGHQVPLLIRGLLAMEERAILIVPTVQRDGHANVWLTPTERLTRLSLDGEIRECRMGGFGCVVFNLAKYRQYWDTGPWFRDGWDEAGGYLSEDFTHCISLHERHVSPTYYLAAYVDHHDRGGGSALNPEAEAKLG
jgi:hypothetical protein